MNTEMQTKIREWEAERDRNLRIHCPLVAAKFQRWIDRAKKENDIPHFQPRDKIFNKKACNNPVRLSDLYRSICRFV